MSRTANRRPEPGVPAWSLFLDAFIKEHRMSSVTIPIIYNGIASVSSASPQFVINLPYTWTGATAQIAPTVFSESLISELDASGNPYSPQATLAIAPITPNSLTNPSGTYTVTIVAINLRATTTAINFSLTLNLVLTPNLGNALGMSYGLLVTQPVTSTNYTFTVPVIPASALSASLTVDSISSNTIYPPAPVATMPPHAVPLVTVPPPPIDTTVTIPVTVTSPSPTQTYLGVIFVLKMLFGAINLPDPVTTE
jgi:hypothetical protein